MRSIPRKIGLKTLAFPILLVPVLILPREVLRIDFSFENATLVRVLQLLSALAAFSLGPLSVSLSSLVQSRPRKFYSYHFAMAATVLAMGLLSGLACLPADVNGRLLWLQLTAQLLGGALASSVWLEGRLDRFFVFRWLPLTGLALAAAFGVWILTAPSLPALIESGTAAGWTPLFLVLSNGAGAVFVLSAAYGVRSYLASERSSDLVFAHFTLFSGATDFVWSGLHLWGPVWWASLFFQTFAFVLVLVYSLALHASLEHALEKSEAELRHVGEQLAQANRDLAVSNTELERFACVASHDLNEPLRTIATGLGVLKARAGESLDPQSHEFLEFALDAVKRLKEMIERILSYARIGAEPVHLEPIDLNEVVDEAKASLSTLIEENQAKIRHAQLPIVVSDPLLMRQVFQNLFANAVRYRGPLTPQIEVTATKTDTEWRICVSDNGRGVAPETRESIFGLFARGKNIESVSGSGVGLATCRRILERLGGRIWCEARPLGGTVFVFTLAIG